MVFTISDSGSHSFLSLFYDFELGMQIYARQDAKQCSEPEVPLLSRPFSGAALSHCKSVLASAPPPRPLILPSNCRCRAPGASRRPACPLWAFE